MFGNNIRPQLNMRNIFDLGDFMVLYLANLFGSLWNYVFLLTDILYIIHSEKYEM